ncbi:MAG: rRNA pseudouridine synthase, partial [Candidatus Marinimicrobia bacterium]|nr:rRNA pseudouridine synthase [Candidatus Neomarinimicrobiota bacterium]
MAMKKNTSGIRLNRYLSLCGIASRRKCEEMIEEDRVAVNGEIATDFSTFVQDNDVVTLDGGRISPQKSRYLLLNKPKGVITTLSDEQWRKHVGMLLPKNVFVKPIGRLDKNTTGVLLFTNDGELHYRLTHPKYQIPRVYQVELDKMYSEKLNSIIAAGVRLNYRETASAKVLHVRHMKKHSIVTLELREGLNREIHRMFKVLGYKVMDLDRISYGGIFTGPIKLGQWRHL